MATVVQTRAASTRPDTHPPPLSTSSVPVPNKHLAWIPTPTTPTPMSPPTSSPSFASQIIDSSSLTYPPDRYTIVVEDPPLYSISGVQLEQALECVESQPLPPTKQVFPWLHGLHAENQLQLAFFTARKRALRRTPKCIRGLTIVKAGNDLSHSKLKGAITSEEILKPCATAEEVNKVESDFIDIDPKDGFGVRNFQIQACKMATVSDIVVYGDARTSREDVEGVACRISRAQAGWQRKMSAGEGIRSFNTFILADDFTTMESSHDAIVAIDSAGSMTNKVMDFFHWERVEMCTMSAATEICHNVWLGPTPDPELISRAAVSSLKDGSCYDVHIEANDQADIPGPRTFRVLQTLLDRKDQGHMSDNEIPTLEFPGSGAILPPTWSHSEADGLMATCEWIYKQANGKPDTRRRRDSKLSPSPERDADGDSSMQDPETSPAGRKILIHCLDGYTESSLLGLAYYMYSEGVPAHEAWLQLHREKGRNFFAYGSDVALLRAIEPRILQASPKYSGGCKQLCPSIPDWFERMDGSFPSRVLPYMYLGNLGHANNPTLLRELGVGHILSVGEPVAWPSEVLGSWGAENLLFIDKVQDNGVDPLTDQFGRCLEFIENGRRKGTATLVHCRVGVSRSATICIAEVMNELGLSFPRAYCFVRARRLNVIIQPHLRFSYELLKWEEYQCQKRGKPLRRELEWATIAREIAAMNKPYSRQN